MHSGNSHNPTFSYTDQTMKNLVDLLKFSRDFFFREKTVHLWIKISGKKKSPNKKRILSCFISHETEILQKIKNSHMYIIMMPVNDARWHGVGIGILI